VNTAAEDVEDILPDQVYVSPDDAGITAGALRMRYSRQRRRDGLRCLLVELRDAEINRLIALGYLEANDREDRTEVLLAVYRFLEDSALGDAQR
jgi:hypothetical protein